MTATPTATVTPSVTQTLTPTPSITPSPVWVDSITSSYGAFILTGYSLNAGTQSYVFNGTSSSDYYITASWKWERNGSPSHPLSFIRFYLYDNSASFSSMNTKWTGSVTMSNGEDYGSSIVHISAQYAAVFKSSYQGNLVLGMDYMDNFTVASGGYYGGLSNSYTIPNNAPFNYIHYHKQVLMSPISPTATPTPTPYASPTATPTNSQPPPSPTPTSTPTPTPSPVLQEFYATASWYDNGFFGEGHYCVIIDQYTNTRNVAYMNAYVTPSRDAQYPPTYAEGPATWDIRYYTGSWNHVGPNWNSTASYYISAEKIKVYWSPASASRGGYNY